MQVEKLLQLFRDCFNEFKGRNSLPSNWQLNEVLQKNLKELGSEKFFYHFIGYVGGRGFNEFLDYGLLYLKLVNGFRDINIRSEYKYQDLLQEMHDHLLFVDRHDLYQNLPYIIDKFDLENKWDIASDALIGSFNNLGTGDCCYLLHLTLLEY